MRDKTFFILICIFIISVSAFGTILSHEEVHATNYKKYGVDSSLGFDLLGVYTKTDTNNFNALSVEDVRALRLENSINEAVSYNTLLYFVGLMCILMVGFIYLKK